MMFLMLPSQNAPSSRLSRRPFIQLTIPVGAAKKLARLFVRQIVMVGIC